MYYEPMVHKPSTIYLPALLVFDCVARHMNFGRAAVELDVTATAISKTVKQLESRLGVRLFNRTTRSVALSEPGAQLFETLAPALDQIRQSLGNVRDSRNNPRGTLRINTSYVAYASLIAGGLPAFLERYPGVELEVALDNRLTDIVADGFDAGIRLGHALHRDMVAVPLGPLQRRLVLGSPKYLAAHAEPKRPEDLMQHTCIRQRLSGLARFFEWSFRVKQQTVTIDVPGRLAFDEMRSVLEAATQGCGLAYVFEQFAVQEISSGALIPVLEKFSPPSEAFHLYYPARTGMPAKLRAFVDFMREVNPSSRKLSPA
jgi:DNA-binding transcriptional LysR family regulator